MASCRIGTREQCTQTASFHCTGGLDIKILPRTAKLHGLAVKAGPPPEQDTPLDIPKRTALYVEQVGNPVLLLLLRVAHI